MKILIDIGHPGHVHLFRPFSEAMIKRGHNILFTCKEKEFEIELLKASGFNFLSLGKHFRSVPGKIFGLLWFSFKLLFIALKNRPDIYLSHGSIYAGVVAWLLRKHHISMEDSGNMEQVRLYLPFTKVVITPDILEMNLGKKQILYNGYHEIAYLHPRYFAPDNRIFNRLSLPPNSDYALIRLVSWKATHDYGQSGLSEDEIYSLVDYLSSKMKVFISAEGIPPKGLEKYLLDIEAEQIHNIIYHARIVVSEGATIASESGVLGTPTIYVNSIIRCYNEDQEKYGTVINLRNGKELLASVISIIEDSDYKSRTRRLAGKIMDEKIDLTRLLVWFLEGYPGTAKMLKEYDPAKLRTLIESS